MTIWLDMPFQIQFRVIAETTVRFARSHDRDDHALLLSPWPESLLAFEPAWSLLAGHSGLVAIDLPGFGHSPPGYVAFPAGDGRVPHPCR